ncbi:MAG: hypothetical protein D6705_17845, partial [Deltaproteobacteria bacterium]
TKASRLPDEVVTWAEVLQAEVEAARAGDGAALAGLRQYAIYLEAAGHHRAAAVWFAEVDLPMHRAIALERAGDDAAAAEAWSELERRDSLRDHPYERALVRLNRALCLHRLGDPDAPMAVLDATADVEEVADGFERAGIRERAFDCYQLLARVGQETGTFVNVAEGYANSIRILRADGLKLDALRLYEAFVAIARGFDEWHATAVALREAAETCMTGRLPYGEDLLLRAGEAWIACAEHSLRAGLPLKIVENAYLAAAEAFTSVRAFSRARRVYGTLGNLALPPDAKTRYRTLAARLSDAPPDPPRPVPVPEFLKQRPDYDEIWYVDLEEFELGGDPGLVAAGVLADRRYADIVRRHALLLVLDEDHVLSPVERIERLEAIRAYPVLSCLEAAFRSPDPTVRRAVAAALGSLRFKRTFGLLEQALADPDPQVVEAATHSVGRLVFPHAFEPLTRLYFWARSRDGGAEIAARALKAIGRIQSVEAFEFVCDRLRDRDPVFSALAREILEGLSNPDLLPHVQREIDLVPPEDRAVLERLLRRLQGEAGLSRTNR